ncbi:MAG: hypothetical protein AAFX06_09945 [Planctomycetota bacterium]
MRRFQAILCAGLLIGTSLSGTAISQDAAVRMIREAEARAEYWQARGFKFDPYMMTADSMDRRVAAIRRATYWKERGFQFDPKRMSDYAMDRVAEAKLRAEYWRRWGIEFDSSIMDAKTMDEVAIKLREVKAKLDEIKKEQGKQPAIAIEAKVAKLMAQVPDVSGVKKPTQTRTAAAAPISIFNPRSLGGGVGIGGGFGGNRGAGFRGGAGGGLPGLGGGGFRRSGGSTARFPPGVDPDDFFQQLSELQSGF